MKQFLLFRTDRVGDFLLTLSLIKIIKINYPKSKITVIASKKNYDYVKTFNVVNKVILLNNNFFSKVKLIFKLREIKYDAVIVHDGKKRSKFISYFLNFKERIVCVNNLIDTQIDIIKFICRKINLNYSNKCLDFMSDRCFNNTYIPFKNYIQLHFDEKWIYNHYIKKYINIEPSEKDLINFINDIISKDKNLIITTGKLPSLKLKNILNKINNEKVKIFKDQSLQELENIVFNCDLLITCHGWISHIASSKKIKQIDIIDSQYPYNKWTSHFRNYNFLNRKSFEILSNEIIDLI